MVTQFLTWSTHASVDVTRELLAAYNRNPEEFEEIYIGAKISFVGVPTGNGINSFSKRKKY